MKTSLIGLPFVWSTTALAVLTLTTVVFIHGWLRKTLCGVTALVFVVTATAVWINHHYAYLPNLGSVLGWRAQDQATTRLVTALAAAVKPDSSPSRISHGLVERVVIPPTTSGFRARPAQVYLPPAWFENPRPRLPVIELLHGTPGTPEDWTRAGSADRTADRWAAQHEGRAPIIVMPDVNGSFTRDTECVDGREGRAETYLVGDVPNWVITHLGARIDRQSWTIAGSSEGGYCALDLALRHPDRFASLIDLSGLDRPTYPGGAARLFAGQPGGLLQHTPDWAITHMPGGRPLAGWFEVGGADHSAWLAATRTGQTAREAGISTHIVVVPGASHTWHLWRRAFADALPWAVAEMQQAPSASGDATSAGPPTSPNAQGRRNQTPISSLALGDPLPKLG